jgi:hypothetical protein
MCLKYILTVPIYHLIGGIRNFASNNNAVRKWCLNRAEQSKNTGKLKEKAGTSTTTNSHSSFRPSKILQSNNAVCEILRVLTEEDINPFDIVIDRNELFNLSSGVPLYCTDVLNCWDIGQSKFEKFTQESISGNLKPFHNPIQKTKITTFKDMTKSTKVANSGKSAVIDANRNILGKLLAISAKHEKKL